MEEVRVVIVGAGPSGIATAGCLAVHEIPSVIIERDDCIASLWRKRTYDRLHLHLAKEFCQLPHFPYGSETPSYISKDGFIKYLDDYVEKFELRPKFKHEVESASFDEEEGKWRLKVRKLDSGEEINYATKYLVVASGENDEMFMPEINGLESFEGEVLHSSQYRSGLRFKENNVLVVGSGNSGMEIAFDLCNHGANASIVVRSPLHLVSREIWHLGMLLMRFLPLRLLDALVLFLCNLKFGNTSKYGIHRPKEGPFYLKTYTPFYPVMDVGTFSKIKSGEIQVLPSLKSIKGNNNVVFSDGKVLTFDAIVFATGYRSTIKRWLKSDDYLLGDDGMCKLKYPKHWKGRNGLYCAGLIGKGIYGSAEDAINIANDINVALKC
ncbi:probable indole-3-pyruvate monooxygenase YUCCA10 [Asparagus officinalis]|uniref:probable indole-3-pyruvate monooxygenase YUCCA10 n=1 Tax=Asparagus officinalis TaxID=4686 RepID=UPI00098E7AF9|nr:probable indole-3-pyruvate monooxygenase YUCCA10 [Asparagus officinalis]